MLDSVFDRETCRVPFIVSIISGEPIVGVIDDLMKTLDRIPIWKRLGEVPEEVDDLKKRVATLEEMLNGKWPAEVCRFCGARAVRLKDQRGPDMQGVVTEFWTCSECGQNDRRRAKPG